MTDAELVQRAIDGDERAFADLVGSFRRPILSHLNRILHDSDGSEDLWQEVQFRVWRNLKRFDQSKKFSTWIFTIGTNLALNELRRRKRHKHVLSMDDATADVESITAFADESDRPDVEHEGKELNQQLAAAVRGLPDTQRHTLILRELQGQSYQEIADATGTRMGTVKSRLARARASVASRVA